MSARRWLVDGYVRYYTQDKALFYSDNAPTETTYISRNRQLGTFNGIALGARASRTPASKVPGKYEIKLNGAYELHALQVQATSPTSAPASCTRYNAQHPAAVRDGHVLTERARSRPIASVASAAGRRILFLRSARC